MSVMKVDVHKGKYVLAVSGGVDSVVLLDILSNQKNLELIVTHFDHGIRENSADDRKFVASLAKKYKLSFEYDKGKLGAKASEEVARKARYDFLKKILDKYNADAIITAHHQDDVLETMIINLLRGTGRKGLTSLKSSGHIVRPLLHTTKQEIKDYAQANSLTWHEDPTNADTGYLRNWIRHQLVPKLSSAQKEHLLGTHTRMEKINNELDDLLEGILASRNYLDTKLLVLLPHALAKETMAYWLRKNGIADFDTKTLERLVVGAKTLAAGKLIEVKNGKKLQVSANKLTIVG